MLKSTKTRRSSGIIINTYDDRWDNVTEVRSTTISEGSTIVQDYQDRCLRRALDHKLRNLRTMLTADEDITTELDKVVCKLMKLALKTSKTRSSPPPTKWMQCKLLDLLTLTEKSIERRKKHIIESSLKATEFGYLCDDKPQNDASYNKNLDDTIVKGMVEEYRQIAPSPETSTVTKINDTVCTEHIEDLMSVTSNEFLRGRQDSDRDMEYVDKGASSPIVPPMICTTADLEFGKPPTMEKIERTKAWLNVDLGKSPYRSKERYDISSEDADSVANVKRKQKRSKHMTLSNNEIKVAICATTLSKTSVKYKTKREEKKKKASSTRITKKVARKKSGHHNIVKNTGSKHATVDYERSIVRSKRRAKEIHCLTIAATKPIPESIIDLCNPELNAEKCVKEFDGLSNVDNTINSVVLNKSNPTFVTEENILVDIRMDDSQDVMGLHRSIGTDVEVGQAESADNNEVDNLSNDIDINLFTRHEVSTENIYSQTIFLNDINEPSTSKGIRHNIGMDVQCGPDTLAAYPMLSASTSLIRNPAVFSAGIKIMDGTTAPRVQGVDFGTTTQENGDDIDIVPRSRSIGIKIKDSAVNLSTTLENFTMTKKLDDCRNERLLKSCRYGSQSPNRNSRNCSPEPIANFPESKIITKTTEVSCKTELIKPISSALKTADSGSEFCGSIGSFLKSTSTFANLSKNASEIILINTSEYKESKQIEKKHNTKYNKPKLCCGGIHVHSYKDRQESEDIIYQGEWQRYKVKPCRKKIHNTILAKKINESGNRKQKDSVKEKKVNLTDKIPFKKPEKTEAKLVPRKAVQVRNTKSSKTKQEEAKNKRSKVNINLPKTDKVTPAIVRPHKSFTNVSKVASKISMNSKHVKSAFTAKKPLIVASTPVKQENNKQKERKSYIPLYMKKGITERIPDKNKLNKSFDSATSDMKTKKEATEKKYPALVRSKTDEIRKDLLNFHSNHTENTYLVFRNDLSPYNPSTDEPNAANTTSNQDNENENYNITRGNSSQSLNSSTCSSPNSVATVRTNAVNVKSKNVTYRRHSSSSYKSSMNTSESDNATPNKTKKTPIKCKSVKKTSNAKDTDNKENIPQTTENFANKETDKLTKSPNVRQRKSVCIAQLKSDRSIMQTRSLLKHKASNKSNIKIPALENAVEKKRSLNMDILIKSSKSETLSETADITSNQNTSYASSECANMVLVVKPQEILTRQQTVATGSVVNIIENSLLNEWMQDTHVNSETTNISNYLRHLVEELLDVIDFVGIMDSTFMTLSLDGSHSTVAINESMCSFKTVTADYLNNTYVNSLNRTFDSVLGDESTVSLTGTRLTVTDLDLLSFKSITSLSKHSEYFLADSELRYSNTSAALVEQTQSSGIENNPTSVTDIFERKAMQLMQNQAGVIANQAFSGFTLDGEPVTGDQPDPISLIDSETGSLAQGVARQATSEELFISSRSSESYASCLIDEDAVVPNWLFQMINQQHSVAEDQPMIGPQPAMLGEPMYDVNGNALDTNVLGVAAGAGDGRGIHSDQSQDSSGRGTSVSSSNTSSSSPQSEAILVEPSGFVAQFELQPDPAASSARAYVNMVNSRDESSRNLEEADSATLTVHSRRRPRLHLNAVSDIDADISSLGTDVPDSDN